MVKSSQPLDTKALLTEFAQMCRLSRTPEKDRQADGWGVAWPEDNHWQLHKSLKPIWQDSTTFASIPQSQVLIAHARSASFANQTGILEYNQPYTDANLAFVFNGLIRAVKLPSPVPGKIGAQKTFHLLKQQLKNNSSLPSALTHVYQLLAASSASLRGLNLGLAQGNTLAALCAYQEDPDYFTLHYHLSPSLKLICSQPIGNYQYNKMKQREILLF